MTLGEEEEKPKRIGFDRRNGGSRSTSPMISAFGEEEEKSSSRSSTERSIRRSIENWARDRRDAQRIVRRHIIWLRRQIGVLGVKHHYDGSRVK